MKQSILLLWLSLSWANGRAGQLHNIKDSQIPVLSAGKAKWAIELTRRWFEENTMYNLTFHNAGASSKGKMATQGFFIFELQALGEALQTALSLDSGYEVHYKDGMVAIMERHSKHKRILVRFTTGSGSFLTTEKIAAKLICAIENETRPKNEPQTIPKMKDGIKILEREMNN